MTACVYPVNEGMEVFTNSPKVMKSRKMTLELLLSIHEKNVPVLRAQRQLRAAEAVPGLRRGGCRRALRAESASLPMDDARTLHLVRDNNKCILCRRCVAACASQFVAVIGPNDRGFDTHIGCAFEKPLGDVACVSCGQCIVAAPPAL